MTVEPVRNTTPEKERTHVDDVGSVAERTGLQQGKPGGTGGSRSASGRGLAFRPTTSGSLRLRPGVEQARNILPAGIAASFWRHVEKGEPNACWLWTGAVKAGGLPYGRIKIVARALGVEYVEKAHRLSWRLHFGPVPEGMHVLHRCDNARCVNPAHLWLGTNADNHHDKAVKGRAAFGRAPASARHSIGNPGDDAQTHEIPSQRASARCEQRVMRSAPHAALKPVTAVSWERRAMGAPRTKVSFRPSALDRALRGGAR